VLGTLRPRGPGTKSTSGRQEEFPLGISTSGFSSCIFSARHFRRKREVAKNKAGMNISGESEAGEVLGK
jgi:hypothetical protein